jgi:hypothetical protein
VDLGAAEERGMLRLVMLNAQYGTNVTFFNFQRVFRSEWDLIAFWPDDLKEQAVDAFIDGIYCAFARKQIPECEPPMNEEQAEKAFREALLMAKVDPNKYVNYKRVWFGIWNHTKDYGANVQKEIYWLFAQYQYRWEPSVRIRTGTRVRSKRSIPVPDTEDEEMILEYGYSQSGVSENVEADLKRKITEIANQLYEERENVAKGLLPYMKAEDLVLLVLLENYGEELIDKGWGPLISGQEVPTVMKMWNSLAKFYNFFNNYDEKMEELVKVNAGGTEQEIPAWKVIVYVALGELLKKLNIKDEYGFGNYDEVFRKMAK